jgi:hypothetical protein
VAGLCGAAGDEGAGAACRVPMDGADGDDVAGLDVVAGGRTVTVVVPHAARPRPTMAVAANALNTGFMAYPPNGHADRPSPTFSARRGAG